MDDQDRPLDSETKRAVSEAARLAAPVFAAVLGNFVDVVEGGLHGLLRSVAVAFVLSHGDFGEGSPGGVDDSFRLGGRIVGIA